MIVLIAAMTLSLTSQTDDSETAFDASQTFARCAAPYDHFANFLDSEQLVSNAEELRGSERGARIASLFFANMAGIDYERVNEFVENNYEMEMNRQAAFIERAEIDSELMQQCQELEPIQVQVVQALRQQSYSPSND